MKLADIEKRPDMTCYELCRELKTDLKCQSACYFGTDNSFRPHCKDYLVNDDLAKYLKIGFIECKENDEDGDISIGWPVLNRIRQIIAEEPIT